MMAFLVLISIHLVGSSLGCVLNGIRGDTSGMKSTPPSPPNIIFMMGDDHTSQAWGVYGSRFDEFMPNPNIRRLVAEGCLLRNAFCTNSICSPSRATILTGQYSHRNGVYTLSEPLPKRLNHLGVLLSQQGYQTAVVGKWHLKTKPYGFDFFDVLPGQGRYNDPHFLDNETWDSGGRVVMGFSADVIGDRVLEWLDARETDRPFFVMCHFKATHEPFDFPARHADLFADDVMPEPPSLFDEPGHDGGRCYPGQVLEILGNRYTSDRRDLYPLPKLSVDGLEAEAARRAVYQKLVKDFLRSATSIDDNIGKVLHYLDIHGLSSNTIVIYTSDQGYFLGERGCFDKRMMLEESLRMPFVIRYPDEIPAGSTSDDIILNTDFAPLMLDYAGASTPSSMQGRSFRTNLRGDAPDDWRDAMYYRYWLHEKKRPAHFGVRTARYKLIFYYGMGLGLPGTDTENTPPCWEFFDLEKDPLERRNAILDPQNSRTVAALKSIMRSLRTKLGDEDLGLANKEFRDRLHKEGL